MRQKGIVILPEKPVMRKVMMMTATMMIAAMNKTVMRKGMRTTLPVMMKQVRITAKNIKSMERGCCACTASLLS